MTFQPLTKEQYQKAISAGFSPDQIIQNEQKRKLSEGSPANVQSPSTDKPNILKSIGGALISSEKGLGNDIAGAIGGNVYSGVINKANQNMSDSDLAYLKAIKNGRDKAVANGGDTSHYDNLIQNFHASSGVPMTELFPALNKSNGQVVGDAAGTLLDILSFGSYGTAAKGAKSFELLSKAEKVVAPATEAVNQGLKQTLTTIGKKTAVHSAVGAGTGYAYGVAQNLQNGETGVNALKPSYGTLLGATVPIAIGGLQAGVAISKETAPRIINSLVKPRVADFSYGKNPGRTVSQMGITGNNMEDFASNIHKAKNDVGGLIGDIYSSPANANLTIDASDEIAKIDKAMSEAAKGGKNNQGIVTTLQNIKDSLLHEHSIDAEGNIIRTSAQPADLSALNPQRAFNLKSEIANRTQFTGRPSDDKTVNSVLKDIYSGLKEKLNNAVGVNNPEITHLNQQYADLTSAEIATRHRDQIIQRSNLTSLKAGGAGAVGTLATLLTGGAALPAVLVGVTAASLEKAFESPAVKTRIAAWLGNESPSVISQVLQKNPEIRTVLYRALPNLSSKLGVKSNQASAQHD